MPVKLPAEKISYSWEKLANPNYITSNSSSTYKASEKFAPLGGRPYQTSPVQPGGSTFTKLVQGLGVATTAGAAAYIFGDIFSKFGLNLYREKFPQLFDDNGNLIHQSKEVAMSSEGLVRNPIGAANSLPNQGNQQDIPTYKKEAVASGDTLLSVLRDAQGLQNHDMQMLVQELVQIADATRFGAAANGSIAQSLEVQNIILSEIYGIHTEQYNALSGIHAVLDSSMIVYTEMMGQVVDVLKDVVAASNLNANATVGVAEQTANVASSGYYRTEDEVAVKQYEVQKLKFETTETTMVDLEGRHPVIASPMKLQAMTNATLAKYHSDYNNIGYEEDYLQDWLDFPDLTELLTATKQTVRYSSYAGGAQ